MTIERNKTEREYIPLGNYDCRTPMGRWMWALNVPSRTDHLQNEQLVLQEVSDVMNGCVGVVNTYNCKL